MRKSILFIFITIFIFTLFACQTVTKSITRITCNDEYSFTIDEFALDKLSITIEYDDNTSKKIDVTDEMIDDEDLELLTSIGKHQITVTYKSFSVVLLVDIKSTDGSFNVTIIDNDIVISSNSYSEATKVTEPVPPQDKEGYNFIGWFVGEEEFDFNTEVNSNIIIEAKYERIKLTVKFMVDNELLTEIEVLYGDTITTIPTATKEGLIFIGWSIELNNLEITQDLVCDAKFDGIVANYTVKFMVDGQIYEEKSIEYGGYITAPLIDPTSKDLIFTGWNYDFLTPITSDIEIVALFEKEKFEVTFMNDNEVFKVVQVDKNSFVEEITDVPIKDGFEFIKWDYDFTNAVTNNIVINAVFVKTYTIIYMNGDEIVKSVKVKNGSLLEEYKMEDTEEENFIGWFVDKELSIQFDSSQIITTDLHLYAKFEKTMLSTYNLIKDEYTCLLYSTKTTFYDKYGWSGYTLTRGNNVLFVTNVIEIIDENTDLNPEISATSCGTLYINKTDKDLTIRLSDTKARLMSSYSQVIGRKNGTITEVISTSSTDYTVVIPSLGFMWCAAYNDGTGDGGNYLTTSMRDIASNETLIYTKWDEKITITFRTSFGEELGTYTCYPGDEIEYPKTPEIEGITFFGWSGNKTKAFYNTTIIAVYANNTQGECVIEVINGTGTGTYNVGDEVKVNANIVGGSIFTHWTDYGMNVSESESYTFIATVSTTIVAHYKETSSLTKLSINGNYVTYRGSSVQVQIPNNYVDQNIEFRAAWVSPITGCIASFKSETQYKAEIQDMLNVLDYYNFNAVVFHIRIYNDALYLSDLNPKSKYMNTTWDALEYVITECHKRGIEFHAWMNPYRVVASGGSNLTTIANNIKAKCAKNIGANASNLLSNGSGVILNPGLPEVRKFIVDTCMEVIENYDVDAIHFDDYFYISDVDDSSTQAKYNTTGMNSDDWRRLQVDTFISDLSTAMRNYNKANNRYVQLGISPSGIYRNGNGEVTYDDNGNAITNGSKTNGFAHYGNYLFSDTVKWINEEWIDYIIPQSYWGFTHPTADYADVMDWWNKVVENKDVKLYSGLGIYMAEDGGNYSWGSNPKELLQQLTYCTKLKNVSGVCLFKYMYIKQYYHNSANVYFENMFNELFAKDWKFKSLIPENILMNKSLVLEAVGNLKTTLNGSTVTITFNSVDGARKYAIYRSDGKLLFNPSDLIDVLGNGLKSYSFTDTLPYSSNFTYTVYAISGSNTLGEAAVSQVKYIK